MELWLRSWFRICRHQTTSSSRIKKSPDYCVDNVWPFEPYFCNGVSLAKLMTSSQLPWIRFRKWPCLGLRFLKQTIRMCKRFWVTSTAKKTVPLESGVPLNLGFKKQEVWMCWHQRIEEIPADIWSPPLIELFHGLHEVTYLPKKKTSLMEAGNEYKVMAIHRAPQFLVRRSGGCERLTPRPH